MAAVKAHSEQEGRTMTDVITLETTAGGRWTATPYQVEQAITLLLPASCAELQELYVSNYGEPTPSRPAWVTEWLILLAHAGFVDWLLRPENADARQQWRLERRVLMSSYGWQT